MFDRQFLLSKRVNDRPINSHDPLVGRGSLGCLPRNQSRYGVASVSVGGSHAWEGKPAADRIGSARSGAFVSHAGYSSAVLILNNTC